MHTQTYQDKSHVASSDSESDFLTWQLQVEQAFRKSEQTF